MIELEGGDRNANNLASDTRVNIMEIKIRHVEPDDYKEIQNIYAQTKTVWGTLQLPFPSAEMWRKRLTEKSNNVYSLVACADNEIVGTLDIWIDSHSPRRRHVGGVGIAVHDEWQSQGIGTLLMNAGIDLADKWLNLVRLELTVYVDNEPAINLYKKFGFKVEGRLEKYAFREGSYVDVYSMARIKSNCRL